MSETEVFKFEKDETILCFHGPLLYEAKVIRREMRPDAEGQTGQHYFVHYRGWKQSWDEWVPESRVLKWDEDNLRKQNDLKHSLTSRRAKKEEKKSNSTIEDRQKKRPRDSQMDREEEYLKRPEVKLMIPDALKIQLVNDWEFVTKNNQLVNLPRNPTVSQLIEDYRQQNLKQDKTDEILNEVLDGIKAYFDKALPNILLYRFERSQFAEVKKNYPGKSLTEVYGAEHLLRLFVQMPLLISHTSMDQDAIAILREHFSHFLAYLEKRHEEVFMLTYETANPAYIANAAKTV